MNNYYFEVILEQQLNKLFAYLLAFLLRNIFLQISNFFLITLCILKTIENTMKNILLIGLGRFGKHVALQLNQLGHEVMAVDANEERVNKVLPFVTNAQIGDSTDAEFLKSLGIGNYDICFVAIGGDFQNSLETTSLLKGLGAKVVISRAERD